MVFTKMLFGIILMTNVLNGFVEVILGSILYDLQCLLHTDLKSLSYLFVAFPFGIIPGFASSAFVISRCPLFLTMFVTVLTLSSALIVLPLAPVIYVTAVCFCVFGFSTALNVSVLLHLLHVYWPGSTRRVYSFLFMFSVGSVCCPLILQPFLSDGGLSRTLRCNGTPCCNDTSGNISSTTVSECQSLWQYPCFAIASTGLCVSFFHLVFHFKMKDETQSSSYVDMASDTDRIEPTRLHMSLMFLFFMPSFPMTFPGLLTSYGASGSQISLGTLNRMLSLFWAFFLVGRLLPACLPIRIKQTTIMSAALFCQLLGGLFLLGTRFSEEAILWTSCLLLGSSGGAFLPAGLAWAGETLKMNPARKSVCLTSMATGFFLPYICGSLMYEYGDELFEYFLLCISVYSVIIFLLLNIVLSVFKARK